MGGGVRDTNIVLVACFLGLQYVLSPSEMAIFQSVLDMYILLEI